MNQDQHDQPAAPKPVEFTVTRGTPTDEELAAVVAVLSAHAATAVRSPEPEPEPRSAWAAYWRNVNAPVRPGAGSWQAAVRGW